MLNMKFHQKKSSFGSHTVTSELRRNITFSGHFFNKFANVTKMAYDMQEDILSG